MTNTSLGLSRVLDTMVLVCRHKPITRTDMYSNLPLTTIHCSSFVILYSLLFIQCSLFCVQQTLFNILYSVFSIHHSRLTTHHSPLTTHNSQLTTHLSRLIPPLGLVEFSIQWFWSVATNPLLELTCIQFKLFKLTTHHSPPTTNSSIKIWIVNFEILNMKSGHWVFCWQTECIEMTFLNLASIHPVTKKRVTQPPIHQLSFRQRSFLLRCGISPFRASDSAMRNLSHSVQGDSRDAESLHSVQATARCGICLSDVISCLSSR
jgi:hypothetical protein